ncbi:MAG TPA: hypothetical protein DCQ06_03110 [Myxococcales bacterium]|nr:hypothetical protein [Myxococcales bacterium]
MGAMEQNAMTDAMTDARYRGLWARRIIHGCVGLILMVAMGCAADLNEDTDDGPAVTPGEKVQGEVLGLDPVTGAATGPFVGSVELLIDATDQDNWVFVKIEGTTSVQASEFVPVDPTKTVGNGTEWDLAFRRYKIAVNGGVSGEAGHEASYVEDKTFEELSQAPIDGWISDEADGDDDDSEPDLAFLANEAWYIYDMENHTLTPRKRVYFVRSLQGEVFKVKIEGYYDDVGTSGRVKIMVGPATLSTNDAKTTGSVMPHLCPPQVDHPGHMKTFGIHPAASLYLPSRSRA